MSEQEIHSTLPTGSPILAYGTASRASRTRRILAPIAGIFVILLVGLILFLRTTVRVPTRAFVLAAVRGGTTLPGEFPTTWKDTAQKASLPVILGIAIDDQGLVPFAVTWRGLVSVQELADTEQWNMVRFLRFASHTISSPAYIRLDARNVDPAYEANLEGPVTRTGTWHTNMRVPRSSAPSLPPGDFAISLKAFPEAWPVIQDALRQNAFVLETPEIPDEVSWSASDSALSRLELRYEGAPSASTIQSFASAAGLHDTNTYKLRDDVVAEELRLPKNSLGSSTVRSWEMGDGSLLKIDVHALVLEPMGSGTSTLVQPSPCSNGGRIVFIFNKNIIARISEIVKIPALNSFRAAIGSENAGRLEVCLKRS